jgi:Beta-lactamase
MPRDTTFRIASVTKPIVAAAARGAGRSVAAGTGAPPSSARHRQSPLDDTLPAMRPITLRDLLTFRLGRGGDRSRAGGVGRAHAGGTDEAFWQPAAGAPAGREVAVRQRLRYPWSESEALAIVDAREGTLDSHTGM